MLPVLLNEVNNIGVKMAWVEYAESCDGVRCRGSTLSRNGVLPFQWVKQRLSDIRARAINKVKHVIFPQVCDYLCVASIMHGTVVVRIRVKFLSSLPLCTVCSSQPIQYYRQLLNSLNPLSLSHNKVNVINLSIMNSYVTRNSILQLDFIFYWHVKYN